MKTGPFPLLVACSMSFFLSSTRAFTFRVAATAATGSAAGRRSAATMSAGSAVVAAEGDVSSPTANNPLLQQEGLPLFSSFEPSHVVPAMESLIARCNENFRELQAELSGSPQSCHPYESVVEAMEKIRAPLEYSWGAVGHLNGVKNSDELREAYQTMQPKVVGLFQEMGQSQAMYVALKQLSMPENQMTLDSAQKRIIDSAVKGMELAGVALEGEKKERFNAIQLRLADLSTTFSNNVLDSVKAWSKLIRDKEAVKGLPASALAQLAASAASAGEEGASAEEGPWRVTLDMPSYLPIMQHAASRELREEVYRAFISRASKDPHNNEAIVREVLELRTEKAKILGYKTHAEVSMVMKMAGSVKNVDSMTEMLRDKAYPAAQRELGELQEYAQANGHEGDLQLWDSSFWAERRKEELYAFKEEELRPYFPLDKVLHGFFSTLTKLFGVTVEAADGETSVWHPDVRFFKVLKEGEHIASFYLDPYSRPENKRGGAWMDVCVGKSRVMKRIPVAYLTCNGSPPVGNTPSLMTFREVETLYHEGGHGLQHMLTTVPHADAAGISNIEWDAVELPSQFMENFVLEKSLVQWRHYETGEPLPEDLLEKLRSMKTYMSGTMLLRQLYFGALDLELHHRYDPTEEGAPTPFEVQRRIAERFTVVPPLPEDRFLCSFGHIMAGGYAAGYYSYIWAEQLSSDAFAAFEEAGLDKEEKVAETGRRFADTVLALGGSMHPLDVFKAFRGREPRPDALLRHKGLAQATA